MSALFEFKYHQFTVPADWEKPDTTKPLTIVVREIVDIKDKELKKPSLLYLKGGPGFQTNLPTDENWIAQLQTRFRVFLLDQRGTGMSTPLDIDSILSLDTHDRTKAIKYLANFRADSIARDIEHIRISLFKDQPFFTFGQSFGGWCTYSYLSLFPNRATGCFLTGGFPPVGRQPKDVYRKLVPQVDKANKRFLEKYPETTSQLKKLMVELDDNSLFSLAQKGVAAGYSPSHAELRTTIESLYFDIETIGRPSNRSNQLLYDPFSFCTNPLYALLHEPIYCEGIAPNWSGETVMIEENTRPDTTNLEKFFLGENILRRTFEVVKQLNPLHDLVDALMKFDGWEPLYNAANLAKNESPVIGTIYENDAAVVSSFARESASLLGNCHVIESDLDHSAYRSEPKTIFNALFAKYDEIQQLGM